MTFVINIDFLYLKMQHNLMTMKMKVRNPQGKIRALFFTSSIAYGYTFKRFPVRAELEYSY